MTRICLTLFLSLWLAACQTITPRTWELPPGVKTLEVNGYGLAYVEKGSGPPVVLVHGALVDYRYLVPVMDALASRHRVFTLSLRHHFPEKWDGKGEYNPTLLASDVAAFIRKLNLGPVHLVGHSYGGTVAFLVARDAPQLLRSVVSMEGMSIVPSVAPALTAAEAAADRDHFARRDALFQRGDVDGALREFISRIGGNWDALPEPIRQTARGNAWTLYAAGKARPVDYACSELRRLPIPVLLVQGEKTTPTFAKTTDNLAQCLSRFERTTMIGAGHVAPRTHPVEFSRLMMDFVSKY